MSTPARVLPPTASVVVIGGGAIGTSIAFHLAQAGLRGVVLLERDQLGSGSTSKAAGGVRAQFSDRINIELGANSPTGSPGARWVGPSHASSDRTRGEP